MRCLSSKSTKSVDRIRSIVGCNLLVAVVVLFTSCNDQGTDYKTVQISGMVVSGHTDSVSGHIKFSPVPPTRGPVVGSRVDDGKFGPVSVPVGTHLVQVVTQIDRGEHIHAYGQDLSLAYVDQKTPWYKGVTVSITEAVDDFRVNLEQPAKAK